MNQIIGHLVIVSISSLIQLSLIHETNVINSKKRFGFAFHIKVIKESYSTFLHCFSIS